jgi:Response regulators consisting of a CheY-like receiver domain and a winged-helix DNA-binding domain
MTSGHVLLVEDNTKIMNANKRMLELNGYTVRTAANIAEAARCISQEAPGLIVLDIMLPDGSGLDFCRELRGSALAVPILFLTVLNESSDIVAGLRAGGDDYLTKPYDYDVFLARIEALLRRAGQTGGTALEQGIGDLTFDTTAQRVYRNGKDALLKPREYALLRLLAENIGTYFPPEVLYKRVWALPPSRDMSTVYAHISSLRRKLGINDESKLSIEQKRGKGYRLVAKA